MKKYFFMIAFVLFVFFDSVMVRAEDIKESFLNSCVASAIISGGGGDYKQAGFYCECMFEKLGEEDIVRIEMEEMLGGMTDEFKSKVAKVMIECVKENSEYLVE